MPSPPEFGDVASQIWIVEILLKTVSQQQGNSYGNIGVAGKIKVDLKSVGIHGKEMLQAGEAFRKFMHHIHIFRQHICYQQLFCKPGADFQHGFFHQQIIHQKRLANLWKKIPGSYDGPGNQMRKKGHVKSIIQDVPRRLDFSPVNINQVAERLKGIK